MKLLIVRLYILFVIFFIATVSYGEKIFLSEDIYEKNGLWLDVKTNKPITGSVKDSEGETQFKNGKFHGVLIYNFTDTGKPMMEVSYKNGMRHGISKMYFETGELMSVSSHKDGLTHGTVEQYTETGVLWYRGEYKNGKLHGVQRTYLETGELFNEVPFKNGLLDGIPKTYNPEGSLIAEVECEAGEAISGYRYNEDGKKKKFLHRNLKSW